MIYTHVLNAAPFAVRAVTGHNGAVVGTARAVFAGRQAPLAVTYHGDYWRVLCCGELRFIRGAYGVAI
jgi:hypothetical protein